MADESNAEIVETTTPAEIAPPKKRRASQPKKVVSEAAVGTPAADSAKAAKGRKKREGQQTGETPAVPAVAKIKAGSKAKKTETVAEKRVTKPAQQKPAPAIDDIADLLRLEEENGRLRKALAEKLRAENADLRKRLGIA